MFMFIRFDAINERDGRTDGQTDGGRDTARQHLYGHRRAAKTNRAFTSALL